MDELVDWREDEDCHRDDDQDGDSEPDDMNRTWEPNDQDCEWEPDDG